MESVGIVQSPDAMLSQCRQLPQSQQNGGLSESFDAQDGHFQVLGLLGSMMATDLAQILKKFELLLSSPFAKYMFENIHFTVTSIQIHDMPFNMCEIQDQT